MKSDVNKNRVFLAVTGLILVVLNVVVFTAAKNGQLAPIENLTLWGAFAVLNVSSLLWAVSLLGLQPLVVAASYVAGGFIAFQGARLLSEVNVAEITTAGATYGAFGALVVGNATAKVRLAFFSKKQVPFVFVIAALLLLDGLLNSQVSSAGWGVMLNVLLLPFILAGGIVGAIGLALGRFVLEKSDPVESAATPATEIITTEELGEAVSELMIRVPEKVEPSKRVAPAKPVAEAPKVTTVVTQAQEALPKTATVVHEQVEVAAPRAMPQEAMKPVLKQPVPAAKAEFPPLEIDKGGEDVRLQETVIPVAVKPPEVGRTPKPIEHTSVQTKVEPLLESEEVSESGKEKSAEPDWLSGHLDLLNNIKKAS